MKEHYRSDILKPFASRDGKITQDRNKLILA